MGWKHRTESTSPAARGETPQPYSERAEYRQHPEPLEDEGPVTYPEGYQEGTAEPYPA